MDWIKKHALKAHLIQLAITILFIVGLLIYIKIEYIDVVKDTNRRMRNIERYVVPDSLIYYSTDTINR